MVILKSQTGKTLKPCTEAEARYLLSQSWAVVGRLKPFTIILQDILFADLNLLNLIRENQDPQGKTFFARHLGHKAPKLPGMR